MSFVVGSFTLIHLSVSSPVVSSIVDSIMHYHFDHKDWLLMPDESILERYENSVMTVGQNDKYAKQHKYTNRKKFPKPSY